MGGTLGTLLSQLPKSFDNFLENTTSVFLFHRRSGGKRLEEMGFPAERGPEQHVNA